MSLRWKCAVQVMLAITYSIIGGVLVAKIKKNQQERQGRSRMIERAAARQKTLRPETPVSRLTDKEIRDYKAEMEKIIIYANSKIDELQSQGLTTTKLYAFQQGDDTKYFDISDINDPGELRAYMTQVRDVLSSIDDDGRRALLETAAIEGEYYRGQFGGQYRDTGNINMANIVDEEGNIIRRAIDPEIAKQAFAAYRRLEETYAALIGRQGQEGVYGSENLIIAIYDYYARGMDGQEHGRDLLEAWSDDYLRELEGINYSLDEAEGIIGYWDDYLSRRTF